MALELPGYVERVTKENGREVVGCTVCGNEAADLQSLTHDCIYQNDLVADGGTVPTETHLGADGLYVPVPLREFTAQVVFRTPRVTIQHFQSGGGELDAYYGGIDETHFGSADEFRDPKNPELAPDQVSIKHRGEDAVVLDVDLDRVVRADGGVHADDLNECWCCGTPTERPSLCPECSEAGCNRFGDGCKSDHRPVADGGVRTDRGETIFDDPLLTPPTTDATTGTWDDDGPIRGFDLRAGPRYNRCLYDCVIEREWTASGLDCLLLRVTECVELYRHTRETPVRGEFETFYWGCVRAPGVKSFPAGYCGVHVMECYPDDEWFRWSERTWRNGCHRACETVREVAVRKTETLARGLALRQRGEI